MHGWQALPKMRSVMVLSFTNSWMIRSCVLVQGQANLILALIAAQHLTGIFSRTRFRSKLRHSGFWEGKNIFLSCSKTSLGKNSTALAEARAAPSSTDLPTGYSITLIQASKSRKVLSRVTQNTHCTKLVIRFLHALQQSPCAPNTPCSSAAWTGGFFVCL